MRKYIIIAVFLSLLIGCVTMPEEVNEAYLGEMTPEEKATINKMEQAIIAKKKEKDMAEKNLAIAEQKIKVSKGELSVLKVKKSLLVEKEKLYSLLGDGAKSAEISQIMLKNDQKIAQEDAHNKFDLAAGDDAKALFEIRETELSIAVARLNLEKAKIGKAFQTRRKDKFEKSMIDSTPYEKYLADQQEKQKKNQENQKKTSEEMKKAEEAMKKTGYGVE